MLKILGAGLSKTGTTSLQKAFDLLGWKTLGFHLDRVEGLFEKSKQTPENLRIYDDLDAVFDLPAAYFWKPLCMAYPELKVILSIRDEDSWWHSIEKHFASRPAKQPGLFDLPARRRWKRTRIQLRESVYGSTATVEATYRAHYRAHNQRIIDTIPASRLLVMDITQGDGWQKLCPFIGSEIPKEVPFPFENKYHAKR